MTNHINSTDHNIKWDCFKILPLGHSDLQCKIKETLLIRDLKPAMNVNIGSEKLLICCLFTSYQSSAFNFNCHF